MPLFIGIHEADTTESLLRVETLEDVLEVKASQQPDFDSFSRALCTDGSAPIIDGGFEQGILVICQKEWAACSPGTIAWIGSEDATTCHILALREPISGATALTHFDDPENVQSCLLAMFQRLDELSNCLLREVGKKKHFQHGGGSSSAPVLPASKASGGVGRTLEAYVVGGYDDGSYHMPAGSGVTRIQKEKSDKQQEEEERMPGQMAQALGLAIISALAGLPTTVYLRLAAIGPLNTKLGNREEQEDGSGGGTPLPCHRGLAVSPATGECRPAAFARATATTGRGALECGGAGDGGLRSGAHEDAVVPLRALRACRVWADRTADPRDLQVWDDAAGALVVAPIAYRYNSWFPRLLALPDAALLQLCSTSPVAEGPRFPAELRAALGFMRARPDWRGVFPGGAALVVAARRRRGEGEGEQLVGDDDDGDARQQPVRGGKGVAVVGDEERAAPHLLAMKKP